METSKKYILIIGGVIIAAIAVVGLFYQNLALFGMRKQVQETTKTQSPAGDRVLNGEGASSAQKPYTIEAIPLDELPPYRGVPVGVINESEASKNTMSAERRAKLMKTFAAAVALLEKNRNDFDAWIEVGSVKHAFGDEIGARDAWEYASGIRPENTTSFFNLGNLYGYYLQDKIKAEKNYKKVLQNDPGYVAGYLALAAFYREVYTEKYPVEAEKVLLAGEKALPLDLNILKALAFLYKDAGNTEKAIVYFEKYLAIDSGNAAIRAELEALRAR